MSVFHQMGHHSNNLIDLPDMALYAGAIFSPINCSPAEAAGQISEIRKSRSKKTFEIVLDPQLYVPASGRGKLSKWPYFPRDFDTGDQSSSSWWVSLNQKLAESCRKAEVDSVCSPTVIPKTFDDKYYSQAVTVGSSLAELLSPKKICVIQTVLANLPELSQPDRPLEIASIVSATDAGRIYVIFVGTTSPRRELTENDELVGAMRLINSLARSGTPVVVGFCSSDVLLWKTAGATTCASGKFFNLRRFTRQRFEEPSEDGGTQLPYWFEEGLVAFLRQGDLARVRKLNLLSEASQKNPFGQEILRLLDEAARTRTNPKSWLALSWRHFLYWFADMERRLADGEAAAASILELADGNWSKLDKAKVLMEERQNDGRWIRIWRNILNSYAAD